MIVSNEHNYANIGIPKTGTVSMRAWLQQYCDGQDIGERHEWAWRQYVDRDDCFVFTVVREPYARCYSLWKWETHTAKSGGIWVDSSCGFEEFLRVLLAHQNYAPNVYMHQADYVRRSGAKCVLRLENINEDLHQLPFGTKFIERFPHLNQHSEASGAMTPYYNKTTEALVWEYCRADFETLGYKRMTCHD